MRNSDKNFFPKIFSRFFFAVFYASLLLQSLEGLPSKLLEESYVSPQSFEGYYYASGSHPLSSFSSLGRKIAISEAQLIATQVIYEKYCSLTWYVQKELENYEDLILEECTKDQKVEVAGLQIFSSNIIENAAHVTLKVPIDALPSTESRNRNALEELKSRANAGELFNFFLIYELNLLGNEKQSLDAIHKNLLKVYTKESMDCFFYDRPLQKIPLFYTSYDHAKWKARYLKFGKSEFFSALEYGPYFNDLCYFAGDHFLKFGYPKTAELFFNKGTQIEFQSEYYKLCRNKIGISESNETAKHNGSNIIDFMVSSGGQLPILDDTTKSEMHRLAVNQFRAKDFNESKNSFINSLQENFNSDTLNYLGRTLEEIGDKEQAIACFKQAVKINPNHAYAGTNLAFSLFTDGKEKEAIDMKNDLLKNPNLNNWCKERLESIRSKTSINENSDPLDFLE